MCVEFIINHSERGKKTRQVREIRCKLQRREENIEVFRKGKEDYLGGILQGGHQRLEQQGSVQGMYAEFQE